MAGFAEPLSERDEQLGAIVFACLRAIEQGQPPDRAALLARHPEFAAELDEFFDSQERLALLTAPLREAALAARSGAGGPAARVFAPGPRDTAAPDRRFGEYQVLGTIGRGGNGVVYRARRVALDRIVALKMLPADSFVSDEDYQRFQNEIQAIAALDHPNIVPIYNYGEHDGWPFFTMKLVEGGSLSARIAATRARGEPGLPPRMATRWVAAVARAVHYAHQRQILHRDLKPANILLAAVPSADEGDAPAPPEHDPHETPFLTDFSLAKRIQGDSTLTETGAIVGTPCYMAPEQAAGRPKGITTATDVYGLGSVLYAALTGRPPFQADTVLETLRQVQECEPVPPGRINHAVDRDLETICLKCLEKHPDRRYGSAREVAEDLDRWLGGEPIEARRAGPWERAAKWTRRRPAVAALVAAVVLVAAAGLAGVVWQWRRAVAALDVAESSLYVNQIGMADTYWSEGGADRAEQLLDACVPRLRRWEWFYLKRLCHADAARPLIHSGPVSTAAFSPDGRLLATGSPDCSVRLWDGATGVPRSVLWGHVGPVKSVAFSPDGRLLASAGIGEGGTDKPGEVRLWDVATGQAVRVHRAHEEVATSVAFSPDGRLLASGGADDCARVWDVATGRETRVLRGHTRRVMALAFSPDGRLLATAGWDATVRLWDVATGRPVHVLAHRHRVNTLAFSRDGRRLASGGGEVAVCISGEIELWDVASGRELVRFSEQIGRVDSVAFDPTGDRLVSAGDDQTVKVWDTATGRELLTLRGHRAAVWGLAFSPDGQRLVSAGQDNVAYLHDASPWRSLEAAPPPRTLAASGQPLLCVAFSPDGRRVATAGDDGVVTVWDAASGRQVARLEGHEWAVFCVAFSPDGALLASGGDDTTVRLWDARTGRAVRSLRGHASSVASVVFGPDGRALASSSQDGTVKIWEITDGRERMTLGQRGRAVVLTVAFSPDGGRIATSGDDPVVRVWNARTGHALQTLAGHRQSVGALAYSPDGRRLASAGRDGFVRIRDATTGREIRTFRGVSGASLAYSGDGRFLAAAGYGGTIKVWDTATGDRVLTLRSPRDVSAAVFGPDGGLIAGAGWDGALRLWDVGAALKPTADRRLIAPVKPRAD